MYSLGLDFGTNSVRALIVDTRTGEELASHVHPYAQGEQGIWQDPKQPELARQHPADYLDGIEKAVTGAMRQASQAHRAFQSGLVRGIGVDATASTPIPVDRTGTALALLDPWKRNVSAMAWLWKDHTSIQEAEALTSRARERHPEYLAICGGNYSSEWFWSKVWHCAIEAPEVAEAAHTWVELADWVPATLTGTTPNPVRGLCAAGHKGWYHPDWGGFPNEQFLDSIHPSLARIRRSLTSSRVAAIDVAAGKLTAEWAARLGLPPGIPVAVGGIDAHMGAVGSGVEPGTLVKILGTSTCDILVHPFAGRDGGSNLPPIPGISGIAPESVLPGHHGLEAGQAAVGDIFNWFIQHGSPGGKGHAERIAEASELRPGESGLIALDWLNGNRNVLMDQRLTGLLVGQTLSTKPAEMYRAWMEATGFGARMILERLEQYGVHIERIVNCGGLAEKNPLLLQIYADITGRSMTVSRSHQTCALGAAIAGAVVGGCHPDISAAQRAMTGVGSSQWKPNAAAKSTYDRLFSIYRQLHDSFGGKSPAANLGGIMKDLLRIRDGARS